MFDFNVKIKKMKIKRTIILVNKKNIGNSELSWCKKLYDELEPDELDELFKITESFEDFRFKFVDVLNELREKGSPAFVKLKPKLDKLESVEQKFAEIIKNKILFPKKVSANNICKFMDDIKLLQGDIVDEIGKLKIRESLGFRELTPLEEFVRKKLLGI